MSQPLQALLRAAIGNAQATVHLRELIQKRVIDDLSPRLSADMPTRIEIACSMILGIVAGRELIEIEALTRQSREDLMAYIAPSIQAILGERS